MTIIEIEIIRVCGYCKKRLKKGKVTCGNWLCQWKHHILLMRKNRKTNQVRQSRRVL